MVAVDDIEAPIADPDLGSRRRIPVPAFPPLGATVGWLARATGNAAIDLLLPPICHGCGSPIDRSGGLCGSCWSALTLIEPPLCDRLGIPFAFDPGEPVESSAVTVEPPDYDRARAVAAYDGSARRLVHRLKYGDRLEAGPFMARMMARAGRELVEDADLITPVPLHWRRAFFRRFNQAAELARPLARRSDARFAPGIVHRIRPTRHQVGLTARQRKANVRRAFRVPDRAREQVFGRRVLLVDDVLTTGATVNAAARVLRKAGADRVDVLVFARVVSDPVVPI